MIALLYSIEIDQMNMITAFLNEEVDKELYVEQVEGFNNDSKISQR